MNDIHVLSIVGLFIALIDFFDLSRGVNRYVKRLSKEAMTALVTAADPDGGFDVMEPASLFMLVLITNIVAAVALFIQISIENYAGQGVLHVIGGFLVFMLITAIASALYAYVLIIVFGVWQSLIDHYRNFGAQPALMKVWLLFMSPLAILSFPIVLSLVLTIVLGFGSFALVIYLLSSPKKGLVGSLGLLIAISPFFV